MKERCEGFLEGNTCQRCIKAGVECKAAIKKKRGRPVGSENKTLRKKVKKSSKVHSDHFYLDDSWQSCVAGFKFMFIHNILKFAYKCVPLCDEDVSVMAQMIPENKVGVVFDCLQTYTKRHVYCSPLLLRMQEESEDMLEMNTEIHNQVAMLSKKNGYRIPNEEILPGPFVCRCTHSDNEWYEIRNVHVLGGANVKKISDKTRSMVIWAEECKGPFCDFVRNDSWKESIIGFMGYNRARELEGWKAHVHEFVRSVSAIRPLPDNYIVMDLLEKATQNYGVLLNNSPEDWVHDKIPPCAMFVDGVTSVVRIIKQLIQTGFQGGCLELPDVKIVRGDCSMFAIGTGMRIYMPKPNTFFPEHNCKVCCITWDTMTYTNY